LAEGEETLKVRERIKEKTRHLLEQAKLRQLTPAEEQEKEQLGEEVKANRNLIDTKNQAKTASCKSFAKSLEDFIGSRTLVAKTEEVLPDPNMVTRQELEAAMANNTQLWQARLVELESGLEARLQAISRTFEERHAESIEGFKAQIAA